MHSFIAFDIETDGLGERPNITCIVTMRMDQSGPGAFRMEENAKQWHEPLETSEFLGKQILSEVVNYMFSELQKGTRPLSWNGTGFDFRVMYAQAIGMGLEQEANKIKDLALAGVDPMLNFFVNKGFPVGLKRVASGFNLALNKTGTGEEAIDKWIMGDKVDRASVLQYCANDVAVLCMVVSAISKQKQIPWVTKTSGNTAKWTPFKKHMCLMDTAAAMKIDVPCNAWMGDGRLEKAHFCKWLLE
jgi:hypothetical protein